MSWTALLPLKPAGDRKTRLSGRLSDEQRDVLAERMLAHVAGVLHATQAVSRIVLLAQSPPVGWSGDWLPDMGRGLNTELEAARDICGAVPLIVLHADLPLLGGSDIVALAEAGAAGCAIAPDRHGTGTNALTLAPERAFRFAFGPNSVSAHRAQGPATLVEREGLAVDLDTPHDLAFAVTRGFVFPI